MAARLGERNNRATATDLDVAMAIELVLVHGLTSKQVAEKFEVSERTVRYWVSGGRRVLRRAR